MKKRILLILLSFAVISCGEQVKVDRNVMKNIKTVAVIYTIKAKIAHRDDSREDDSDLGAWPANTSAYGFGENAANLAFPELLNELNNQNLPFKVLTVNQLKANAAFMALQPEVKVKDASDEVMRAALTSVSSDSGASGPTGFVHLQLPDEWEDDGNALTGEKGEMAYIKNAIKALGVDAVLVISDRGASYQCRAACILGNGDATMGGALNTALVSKSGSILFNLNSWFDGSSHALMARYIVNPLQRDKLYTQHGINTAKNFAQTYRESMM
ncbi:MAG: hypothetical protein OEL79_02145 [Chromatiales bacterium]|nr:hypothetical protein [Chromatiales bacterium]